ncbi:hypothetical protein OHT59_40685 [Streptomyces sp. NBC_00243]|uniref:MAB_1171c family putative transporter n=1 Tax=Streptomyces sp. NBC_00243 TaxID=2975688 RepID=UPI002DDC7D1E|nr:MAB_1171c family putative transporter [Streptomyces sp. NBC_00243]WRZ24391.1 hypothetical protein OHT59_40685 [Streptomyces sp. NBC_00243]
MIDIADLRLPYAVPTVLLLAALVFKSPAAIRSWRNPDSRVTWFVMLSASAVFVSVAPASLHKINTVTGVPNLAAPWTYSLLMSFCCSCMTMIITWREAPSPKRRRRIHWVWAVHAAIIVTLWGTFLLADLHTERIYDLDTYYANTPWMREHIVLYLLAYAVSTLVCAGLIWTWISEVQSRWLKAGLVFLQVGYAFGIVFAVAKLIAISARWAGTDWDFLSIKVAPPFALLGASLVGLGFLLPVCGPFLQTWPREQVTYWMLRPLERSIRKATPSLTKARVGRWAPLDLRLLQRRQHILDGLLRIAPYFDHSLYHQAYQATSAQRHEAKARGLAGAFAVRDALKACAEDTPRAAEDQPSRIGAEVTDHIVAISCNLRHPRRVDRIRQRLATTESVTANV